MNVMVHQFWQQAPSLLLSSGLLDASLKSLFLLTLALVCCFVWRRSAAATRHLVWFGAVAGALSFPLITPVLPALQRPLWTVGTQIEAGNQLAVVVAVAPQRLAKRSMRNGESAVSSAEFTSNRVPVSVGSGLVRAQVKLHWVSAALLAWSSGVILALTSIVISRLILVRQRRAAHPCEDRELRALVQELSTRLRLRRPVTLLQSRQQIMPVTWGCWRPVIMVPSCADQWPIERKRVVLLHELAHIKRWDCLTQLITHIACAIYWFNPLIWVAARQMRIERERACDDLVLNAGPKPSEYAAHLLEIAITFRPARAVAGIAMARSSQLRTRISFIVDASRRRRLTAFGTASILLALFGIVAAIGANQGNQREAQAPASQALLESQLVQLRSFSAAKLKQSQELASTAGEHISPEFQRFFDAAITGDSQTVTNMYEDFKRRHPQYSKGAKDGDPSLSTAYWSPVLEICLAYDQVVRCDPKYTALLADGIIGSLPPGSIYFGGTDPGRGIPTAFSRSQIDGDPFFTLTQNALADETYLEYLKQTYGEKIYIPTQTDSQQCFGEYSADAVRRLEHDRQFPTEPKQIRPGENVRMENGKGAVSGQVAVMSINGLLARIIFDRNPNREFYIEESFPLEWMYPYLEPHGQILKINRDPITKLSDETLTRDRAYWQGLVASMLGGWLKQDTSVKTVADFAEKVFVQRDFDGFSGDEGLIQNDYAKRLFSKLRSSIGGVYAWRAAHSTDAADAQRMTTEADLAFRQAFALCPYSPEAVFRYATFLSENNRSGDALVIATSAAAVDPKNSEIQNLVRRLKQAAEAK